jgi:hypothetical protein
VRVRVRLLPVTAYPSVLNVSPAADTPPAATVTVPGTVPPDTATCPAPGHTTFVVPSNQLAVVVSQVPDPPRQRSL